MYYVKLTSPTLHFIVLFTLLVCFGLLFVGWLVWLLLLVIFCCCNALGAVQSKCPFTGHYSTFLS